MTCRYRERERAIDRNKEAYRERVTCIGKERDIGR